MTSAKPDQSTILVTAQRTGLDQLALVGGGTTGSEGWDGPNLSNQSLGATSLQLSNLVYFI
jgi:hypothetical protein